MTIEGINQMTTNHNEVEDELKPWQALMEDDSTLQDYVARHQTDEATSDDYLMLAGDSITNGNFTDAASYIKQSLEGDVSLSDMVSHVDTAIENSGSDRSSVRNIVMDRLESLMEGVSPR